TFATAPSIDTSGQLTFEADADSNGSATFMVRVQDSGSGTDTSVQAGPFTITINPINDAPTLTNVNTLTGAFEDTLFSISYATLAGAADEGDIDSSPVEFRVETV